MWKGRRQIFRLWLPHVYRIIIIMFYPAWKNFNRCHRGNADWVSTAHFSKSSNFQLFKLSTNIVFAFDDSSVLRAWRLLVFPDLGLHTIRPLACQESHAMPFHSSHFQCKKVSTISKFQNLMQLGGEKKSESETVWWIQPRRIST